MWGSKQTAQIHACLLLQAPCPKLYSPSGWLSCFCISILLKFMPLPAEQQCGGQQCGPSMCGLPAASSEQLVQGSKPSSTVGTASVPQGVLPGSGTALHQQVNAAVGPAAEAMGAAPLRPYRRAGFAGRSPARVLQPAGVVTHPTTKVPLFILPYILAATTCFSSGECSCVLSAC